jgi:casein kinase II subunit alpha
LNFQKIKKFRRPVKTKKIQREISILQNLSGGPNIIQLLDVVKHKDTSTPALIMEKVNNVDFRVLYPSLTPKEVCYYMHETLKGLDFAHRLVSSIFFKFKVKVFSIETSNLTTL